MHHRSAAYIYHGEFSDHREENLTFSSLQSNQNKKPSYSYYLSCRYVIQNTCGYILGKLRTTKLPSKVGDFNPSPELSSKNLVCFDALGSCGFIKINWLNLNTVPKNRYEIASVTRKLNVLWQIYNLIMFKKTITDHIPPCIIKYHLHNSVSR